MKQKQTFKLNESQLRDMIKESVKKMLGESWQDSADEWGLSHIANEYNVNPGNDIDSLDKEARLYQKFKQEFEEEFGIGSLEKAQEMAHRFERFGINPGNFLFKHFTSPATQAYDNWNTGRN